MKILLSVTAVAMSLLASEAQAQACADDLGAINAEISDPRLKSALASSIDDDIAKLGGLDAALKLTRVSLTTARDDQKNGAMEQLLATQKDPAGVRKLFEEAIRFTEAFLEAVECRASIAPSSPDEPAPAPSDAQTTDPGEAPEGPAPEDSGASEAPPTE